ncbi:MAG TPA: class I SAM-dependent methyltransferase, partial [Oligoflexia bacterium]|nr:class I SAM-dependent methyltransferase [Oligoflexia bacterium]
NTLLEINRVLRPGGIAAFLDFSKPKQRALQKAEFWLLKLWCGFWGALFHRNPEVYSYIAESLNRFPDRAQLRRIFREKGFAELFSKRFFFGVIEVVIVQKESGAR